MNVSSTEAEDLHMKPDVAAVILSSHQQQDDDDESVQQELHANDVIIEEDSFEEEIEEDGTCWYEVLQLIPSTLQVEEKRTRSR